MACPASPPASHICSSSLPAPHALIIPLFIPGKLCCAPLRGAFVPLRFRARNDSRSCMPHVISGNHTKTAKTKNEYAPQLPLASRKMTAFHCQSAFVPRRCRCSSRSMHSFSPEERIGRRVKRSLSAVNRSHYSLPAFRDIAAYAPHPHSLVYGCVPP